jgi:2,3-bisphosphoglycerate-independent phosphoglycerate mutase
VNRPREASSGEPHHPLPILLLFLDGVGIGPADPDVNPFFRAGLPNLTSALGGTLPSLDAPSPSGRTGRAFPLDASLGVDGLPQSGTGQIALFTGRNAPALFGSHFGPWPPVRLRPLLREENLLVRARHAGVSVTFANAYPAGWPGALPSRRHAVPPLAALSAGVLSRDLESLARGDAVASEILNDGWRRFTGRTDLPEVTAQAAGRTLAGIARGVTLTLFAHYHTDHAGHRGGMEGAVRALERVDAFLGGLLEAAGPSWIVGCSDHGNIEDVRRGHTRNPALGFVIRAGDPGGGAMDRGTTAGEQGGAAARNDPMTEVHDLMGVTPTLLAALGIGEGAGQDQPHIPPGDPVQEGVRVTGCDAPRDP